MDIKELKKLIEQVQAERKQVVKEAYTTAPYEYDDEYDDESAPPTRTTKHQDALSVIKFFMEEQPEAGTPAAAFISDLENMINVAKQLEATSVSANTAEEVAELQKKIKDPFVLKTIADIMVKSGMGKAKIAAFIRYLKPTVSAPEDVKASLQGKQPEQPEKLKSPEVSVSPTSSTVLRPSGVTSGNNTNPGSPVAIARQAARKGSSTKP